MAVTSMCTPAAGENAVRLIYPQLQLAVGDTVAFVPDATKTGAKDGAMEIQFTGDSLCAIMWLHKALDAHERAGQPISNYITRPYAGADGRRRQVTHKPLHTSSHRYLMTCWSQEEALRRSHSAMQRREMP